MHAVGQGLVDTSFGDAGGFSVPIDIASDFDEGTLRTVEGVWAGEGIEQVRIVEPIESEGPPAHAGGGIHNAIVPSERRTRDELLAQPVLDAVNDLRNEGLLFYAPHRMIDGWVSVACVTAPQPTVRTLEPLVGKAISVVTVDGHAYDLERVSDALDVAERENQLVSQGFVMSPSGEYHAWALVRMVTPGLHDALAEINSDALHLDAWITRA